MACSPHAEWKYPSTKTVFYRDGLNGAEKPRFDPATCLDIEQNRQTRPHTHTPQ
jgi:hypothetical protein